MYDDTPLSQAIRARIAEVERQCHRTGIVPRGQGIPFTHKRDIAQALTALALAAEKRGEVSHYSQWRPSAPSQHSASL